MRIVAGKYKSTALASVGKGDSGAHLRPTTDRVRESIFNLLVNGGYGDPIADARVLDLFAGTGALGFEALSRGASFALFVDDGVKARALIRQNIDILRVIGVTKLFRRDATKMGPSNYEPFNLIFLDPPYGKNLGGKALAAAAEGGWLAQNALVVWEEGSEQIAIDGFEMLDARKYGDTWVHILQHI
ncbi:16S rRNA (guanine(966)-N(2))-methyltransferase RsmD [Amylibacter sp. SFDW26]|uniref:16S rRNA (guanine(966)-N(2))-methyltransferase RsmD n=1 Tax=Amylibacter sp. SFDW26 TaxID=2652722 RepID=UPI0012628EBC|nr:16S rRNA (guanine(966)-N(2))-methyltransferase RsmD [Amylibacter sp. SFDW26]KAB7614373.1 16S rRNA (guanine(966)-N(2))-methyltransferase RsmD [Amylibacter sp. SFDW26]